MASGGAGGASAGLPSGFLNMLKSESTPITLNQTAYTGFLASCVSQLGEPISEGGTARVYLIYSEGSFYIIKKIHSRFLDKFRKEVGFLIQLQKSAASPYVVQYLADLETDKGYFILFPFEPGMTLHKWLTESHSKEDKTRMKEKVEIALKAIHDNNVIHGDVKANNIWVRTDGSPFILDFGESGEPGDSVTIARSGFSSGRAVNARKLSPGFNFQKLDIAFEPPLMKKDGPLDILSKRINELLHPPPPAPSAPPAPCSRAAPCVACNQQLEDTYI